MSKKLAIIGAGGHGKVVGEIALLNDYKKISFFDDRKSNIKSFPFRIINNLEYLKKNLNEFDDFFVAIGDNKTRSLELKFLKNRVNIINLIHPQSIVSRFSSLGIGNCVMANATINAGAIIKEGVIINTSASIDHDCVIDDYSHISPNSTLSGNVKIGKFTHIGAGTSIHPGIQIGNNVKTGVGSKVFKDILNNTIFKN
jgi:UDP-N-acetylbacillosamine N-acetyltransferase